MTASALRLAAHGRLAGLGRALVGAALVLACGSGTPPAELRLQASGESQDLLCAVRGFARQGPRALARAPAACACGDDLERSCFHVDVGDDRRRALVLDAPGTARAAIAPGGAESLRFSLAALGSAGTHLEVRARLVSAAGEPLASARYALEVGAPWLDARLGLGGPARAASAFEVEVSAPAEPGSRAVALLGIPRLVTPTAAGSPTNIVVYLIDTLRPDHTSAYGYARPTTPALAALARDAVVFENAYSTAPWTRPSTASLLTSLHTDFHGVHSGRGLASDLDTLAERFRRGGWSTWAFVASAQVYAGSLAFEQGFDRFVAVRGSEAEGYARSAELDAELLPWIERFGDERFLLFVHAIDPHSPYDAPVPYRDRFADGAYAGPVRRSDRPRHAPWRASAGPQDRDYLRALYDEDVLYQDAMFQELLGRLEEQGLMERTLVVVASDHGEEFYEHGDWEHGWRLYEEQLRVPLLLAIPGLAPRRIAARVQLIDVMPTLLGLFGLPGREACQGRDLRPLLAGAEDSERPVYAEELRPAEGLMLYSLTRSDWKLIERRGSGGEPDAHALFDLRDDPGEQRNRAGDSPERLRAMVHELHAYQEGLAAGGIARHAGPPVEIDPATRHQLEILGYGTGGS